MIENKRETGAKYEELAAQYLVNSGYKIIELNYRIKTGEIDIIASDINTIVFCEVKYRRTNQYGYPEEAVNYIKQSKIRKTASYYLLTKKYPENTPVRFDVVSILGNEIKLIKDAF